MRFLRLLTVFFRLNISFCFIFRFCIYFYICVLWIFFILIINIFFVHTFAQFHIVLWKLTGFNCLCLALDIDLISNRDLWQQMLRFSLPMIPAQISFWVINASDLFFVREMCGGLDGHSGDAWSGLLSTGYFLPTILTTLGLIFYDAWQLSAVTEEEGRARFFTKIFRT